MSFTINNVMHPSISGSVWDALEAVLELMLIGFKLHLKPPTGVPIVAQWQQTRVVSMRTWVRFLASLSWVKDLVWP